MPEPHPRRVAAPPAGVVVLLSGDDAMRSGHELASRTAMARRLAALLGYAFAGEYDAAAAYTGHVYFVPRRTLLGDAAARLGIRGERDLFGGVVPDPFVANKSITHGVVDADAQVPPGWSHALERRLIGVVLPGYSAFRADDARRAGRRLLEHARVRIKPAHQLGGNDQSVVGDGDALDAAIDALDARELAEHGVVLEENIESPTTYSVGEVHVGDLRIAYHGTQHTTPDVRGRDVYGGSDLRIVRGTLADLLRLDLGPGVRRAVEQAAAYDRAVAEEYPGFFASRRNYDVVQGADRSGEALSGVLEQSWRIGGASPAEIAALEAFRADPALRAVRASTHESHAPVEPPPGADVYYRGAGADDGPMLKYSLIEIDTIEANSDGSTA